MRSIIGPVKEFNLYTVVRLPNGVFAPYTSIPTNVLFFERSGPTQDVWFYEHPPPEGRKNYTKTQPLQFEKFAPLIAWWNTREENDCAWKVSAADILAHGGNLDRKNPRVRDDITHLLPEQIAADILQKEQRIAETMENIRKLLAKETGIGGDGRPLVRRSPPPTMATGIQTASKVQLLGIP
jgi:type I restriction enzyme M protein